MKMGISESLKHSQLRQTFSKNQVLIFSIAFFCSIFFQYSTCAANFQTPVQEEAKRCCDIVRYAVDQQPEIWAKNFVVCMKKVLPKNDAIQAKVLNCPLMKEMLTIPTGTSLLSFCKTDKASNMIVLCLQNNGVPTPFPWQTVKTCMNLNYTRTD